MFQREPSMTASWKPAGVPSSVAAAPANAVEVTVQTHFDDPGMAEEGLLHVGQLARDGIGGASLHLNPAEMGPIRVQITLDGQQARIDFAATHAATRELLEASLAPLWVAAPIPADPAAAMLALGAPASVLSDVLDDMS